MKVNLKELAAALTGAMALNAAQQKGHECFMEEADRVIEFIESVRASADPLDEIEIEIPQHNCCCCEETRTTVNSDIQEIIDADKRFLEQWYKEQRK